MLSRKIRIDSFILDEEKEEICQYSKSLSDIYKNLKIRYRVSLDDLDSSRVFKKLFIKSYTEFMIFISFI